MLLNYLVFKKAWTLDHFPYSNYIISWCANAFFLFVGTDFPLKSYFLESLKHTVNLRTPCGSNLSLSMNRYLSQKRCGAKSSHSQRRNRVDNICTLGIKCKNTKHARTDQTNHIHSPCQVEKEPLKKFDGSFLLYKKTSDTLPSFKRFMSYYGFPLLHHTVNKCQSNVN